MIMVESIPHSPVRPDTGDYSHVVPEQSPRIPAEHTFQNAHVAEIIEDARIALEAVGITATVSLSNHQTADRVSGSTVPDMSQLPRNDGNSRTLRGEVTYKNGSGTHGIGIEAFPDNSLRVVIRDRGTGWASLRDVATSDPRARKVGGSVVRVFDGDWQQGRVAQVHLGRQIDGMLPNGASLPNYADKYLPTKRNVVE